MIHYLYVVVPLCVAVVMFVFFQLKRKINKNHLSAIRLAAKMRQYGIWPIADLLEKYATCDYAGALHDAVKIEHMLLVDPSLFVKFFDEVFGVALGEKLKTPEGRSYLKAAVEDAVAKAATVAK